MWLDVDNDADDAEAVCIRVSRGFMCCGGSATNMIRSDPELIIFVRLFAYAWFIIISHRIVRYVILEALLLFIVKHGIMSSVLAEALRNRSGIVLH